VLLAPERVLVLDEIARAVLAACDGARTVTEIAAALATTHDAPALEIARDVRALLTEFRVRGLLERR
jgi:pyrroloquinoline quinone biosynthesis protein D